MTDKAILEFAGWSFERCDDCELDSPVYGWVTPNGDKFLNPPTIDLNFLFREVVPLVGDCALTSVPSKALGIAFYAVIKHKNKIGRAGSKDPTEALNGLLYRR